MQSRWYQNLIPEVFHTPDICIYVFKNSDNQSQNIVVQPLFTLKNMFIAPPIPPIECWESVTIFWNWSDDCLVHLAGLKLKMLTLKLGGGVYVTIFVGDCLKFKNWCRYFQTFLNKLTNKVHAVHTTFMRRVTRCITRITRCVTRITRWLFCYPLLSGLCACLT